ncbi:ribonuclease H-like domain-containing protein, partial [Crepidotus variabilis]
TQVDESKYEVVYSDGACKGNGKADPVAGIGVWWGHDDHRNLGERCPGEQTNNRAELIAILRVLEETPISKRPLLIKTDSKYSIDCLQNWFGKWSSTGWKNSSGQPVKNRGVIECIDKMIKIRNWKGQAVDLVYVKGHSGHVGNDGADFMANIGTTKSPLPDRDWEALLQKLTK